MISILMSSLLLLLIVLVTLDLMDRATPIEWAESGVSVMRVQRMVTVIEQIPDPARMELLDSLSVCHDGFTLTDEPYPGLEQDARTNALAEYMNTKMPAADVVIGHVMLDREDFAYALCTESEIDLPSRSIVVSARLSSGQWLNTEIHPHEWHFEELLWRFNRYGLALLLVGTLAIVMLRRLTRPLRQLTDAAGQFADGLRVSPVEETGPIEIRRAIGAFNAMQEQVSNDVKARSETLAAISHDLRTPLTALRLRGELVKDKRAREDLVASIDKMERMATSALEYLRSGSLSEPKRLVDLGAVVASECSDLQDAGMRVRYASGPEVTMKCHPDALARAVRNLVENANRYADGAVVELTSGKGVVEIVISDQGPGISEDQIDAVLKPFGRLSTARESHQGGFGLGLAIVQAIARGHGGDLKFASNDPRGLMASIELPLPE